MERHNRKKIKHLEMYYLLALNDQKE